MAAMTSSAERAALGAEQCDSAGSPVRSGESRPEIDFDHHSVAFGRDPIGILAQTREQCPVAWTESHGGFWLLSRYRDIYEAARDDWTFSSRHDIPNNGRSYTGIKIPGDPQRYAPIETDVPRFVALRGALNPLFSPATIKKYRPSVQHYIRECIDAHIETGSIDFVLDFANPVPAKLTLEMLGIPVDEWEMFAYGFHTLIYSIPGSAEMAKAHEALAECAVIAAEVIAARRVQARDDIISRLTQVDVEGERLGDEEIVEIVLLILGGGLDTTTALVANALAYLHQHPDQRRYLIDNPDKMSTACEEFLRYYSPVQLLARTATKDVELGGEKIRADERIALCWSAGNHDPDQFDEPDTINLNRFPNRHMAFGIGGHRCLGSNVARMEVTEMLSAVMARMPDYEILDGARPYPSIGVVNGYVDMPARFTPRARGTAVANQQRSR